VELKAEKRSLRKLLSVEEQQFRIPPYQRPYAWTSEQVDDLWDDLAGNVTGSHFLGSVVLSTEEEMRPQVIDGQQRLTTLMLLLSVLRDACHERGLTQVVDRINKRLIADDLASGDAYFKFKSSPANWPVFRDLVLRGPGDVSRKTVDDFDKHTRERNRPLLNNLSRLRTHLANRLSTLPEHQQDTWLEQLHKFLMERVELVVIEVENLADAFLLFETLNDRGLQLSAADLLKSHLLGEVARTGGDEDVDAAAADWDSMLEDLGAQVDVSRFLRHYLLARHTKVQKENVFGFFKLLIADSGAIAVLNDLRKAAANYGEFEAPDRIAHEPTRRVLKDLQTLRATSCYIALLPARRYLSERDFLDYARLAEVLTFRYSSVVGLGTNELERKYHDAARLLLESEGSRLPESRAALVAAMPGPEQFTVAFERLTMGRQYLLRYALRKIEQSIAPGLEKEIKTSDLVHIEHVMPQTLSPEWRLALGEDVARHGEFVNRWGNLTLFFAGLNIPASNKAFEEKKSYYVDSQVDLTRRLCEYETWGPAQIEERQRWLAEVAEQLWRVDELTSASPVTTPSETLERFRAATGELWSRVEPLCVETSTDEMRQLAERLPAHLVAHQGHKEQAEQLSNLLLALLAPWDAYDASQRTVARAAAAYFLEAVDAVPDELEGGLADDEVVVRAALEALGIEESAAA
jgi:uncharacterized membrane protein YkvA (DUF1232 family)